ncbi:MerR family transcriptional regulator [Agilicoccus flavus]|uniref:MerR family transcriptional regulator n=1 Tax=Agilicoccus flavus TaxID=2775968 RepID=UPI001CF6190D|nr:MerR family transcriptional regulator [Agilicoccus flavus]
MLIGDFARLGQVSVRMLRHYDATGLLRPVHVDEWTGYRSYDPEQLPALNRIIALRDLGFSLDQIGGLVADGPSSEELRGMYRLRRSQIEDEMRAARTRLATIESRLRMIEKENTMPTDYVLKTVPAVRLAALRATLDPDSVGEHVGPMFRRVEEALSPTGANLRVPMATYDFTDTGMNVVVGFAHDGEPPAGLEVVDLPVTTAVCGVHVGPMTTIGESWQQLHRWIVDGEHDFAGPCRELYVRSESEDQADWVTELQQPVTTA